MVAFTPGRICPDQAPAGLSETDPPGAETDRPTFLYGGVGQLNNGDAGAKFA